jgi:hypothetical protein
MAVTIQSYANSSSGSAGTGGGTSKPTGTTAGDLLIAIVTARNTVTSITPTISGWNVIQSNLTGSGSTFAIFYRIATGDEGSSFDFTFSESTRWCVGVLRITGHDAANPIDASAKVTGSLGGVYVTPSVTTTVAGCLIIRSAHHMRGNSSFGTWASGTELWDMSGGSLTAGCIQTASWSIAGAAGATGTVQVNADTSDVTGAGVTVAIRPAGAAAIQKDLTLDYAIQSIVVKDLTLDYSIAAAGPVTKDLTLEWHVAPKVQGELTLDYSIALFKDLSVRWRLLNEAAAHYAYKIVNPGTSVLVDSNFNHTVARPVIGPTFGFSAGLVIPDVTPLPPVQGSEYLYFYADYYLRIWIDPTLRRISNPRLHTPYSFSIWNAYPNQNYLVDATPVDLLGVELSFTPPLGFTRYQYRTVSFSLDETAPARLDGRYDFEFTYGEAALRIIATVVEVARLMPNEPIVEAWVWKTAVSIAEDGTEQRAALRNEPRYRLSTTTTIRDDDDRRQRFNQLWAFLSRDIRQPFYQYMTRITVDAALGEDTIYCDTSKTDLRVDEYAALFDPLYRDLTIVKITSIESDHVVLETPLDIDVTDEWYIVPTVAMRMPDGTTLSQGVFEGTATINAESVQYRELVRDPDAASVTYFDELPVVEMPPIATSELDEAFTQGSGIVDNEVAVPRLYSWWNAPAVEGKREWKIERDDVDYWRIFMSTVKGMLNPFLLPTFRSDIEVYGVPALSANSIETTTIDYAAQWENDAYKRIRIQTVNGVLYRKVTSITDTGGGRITLVLDSPIGSDDGDNQIVRISHLHKVRLANDTVTLAHYANWTTLSFDIRTINE